MKIYVAARAKHRLAEVRGIHKKLQTLGHIVNHDWTMADVKRPYRNPNNRVYNVNVQAKMLKEAAYADVFILLDEPGLRGAYAELGAFLTDCLENSKGRRAYIVGPNSAKREFIFESPRYVKFADTIEEVYRDLKR